MYKKSCIAVLFLLLVLCLGSLPPGWRVPAPEELADDWRDASSSRYAGFTGDFTGDGIADEARLLLREDGTGFGLFAFVRQTDNSVTAYVLDAVDDVQALHAMGITPVLSGDYKTACGKGYWDCQPGEPETLHLPYLGIEYFKEGSAASYYYWDAGTCQFVRVWIRD